MADEYIKREDAVNAIRDKFFTLSICVSVDECKGMKYAQDLCAKAVENCPAADVAPVVRCEDCIHLDRGENESESWFYCKLNAHDRYEGFFCAAGERRGNDGSA